MMKVLDGLKEREEYKDIGRVEIEK